MPGLNGPEGLHSFLPSRLFELPTLYELSDSLIDQPIPASAQPFRQSLQGSFKVFLQTNTDDDHRASRGDTSRQLQGITL